MVAWLRARPVWQRAPRLAARAESQNPSNTSQLCSLLFGGNKRHNHVTPIDPMWEQWPQISNSRSQLTLEAVFKAKKAYYPTSWEHPKSGCSHKVLNSGCSHKVQVLSDALNHLRNPFAYTPVIKAPPSSNWSAAALLGLNLVHPQAQRAVWRYWIYMVIIQAPA